MEICYRTGSILFPLHMLAVAGFFLMCFIKFIEVLRYRLLPRSRQNLKRRKKRAVGNKNKPETDPNKDVPVADNSHPQLKDSAVQALPQSNSQLKDSPVKGLRQFTYQSLEDATSGFGLHLRMNADGLGDVFRGRTLYTHEEVAIRRLKLACFMTNEEFCEELLLLSQLNHPNLAKLIGYSDRGCRALVYEYLHGGSLENYLHGYKMSLDWRTRMNIVLGVARAIEHLHNVMNPPILHCYIEPANVWLDEDFTPKLSAAGVLRMFPIPNNTGCPIETDGSYGIGFYDFCLTKTVTVAADIYGFGILLLEVITAKKGIFYTEDGERQTLIDWVQPYFKDGHFTEMVDPRLKGKIDVNELNEACAIAGACLEKQPGRRPQIADVLNEIGHTREGKNGHPEEEAELGDNTGNAEPGDDVAEFDESVKVILVEGLEL